MPATIEYLPNNLCVLRISGTLQRAEFSRSQNSMAEKIDHGGHPRVLAILEDFQGWQRTASWDDLQFQLTHGGEITKIAIVGEPRWETDALAFAGAGFRDAPVKYFPTEKLAQARVWLAE